MPWSCVRCPAQTDFPFFFFKQKTAYEIGLGIPAEPLFRSASALAGGAMSKLFGGGQKAASGGIQGDVLATDNNTVGMGDAGIKSAIQGSNVPNPDEAVPGFVSGAMAKAGKGLLERSEERRVGKEYIIRVS